MNVRLAPSSFTERLALKICSRWLLKSQMIDRRKPKLLRKRAMIRTNEKGETYTKFLTQRILKLDLMIFKQLLLSTMTDCQVTRFYQTISFKRYSTDSVLLNTKLLKQIVDNAIYFKRSKGIQRRMFKYYQLAFRTLIFCICEDKRWIGQSIYKCGHYFCQEYKMTYSKKSDTSPTKFSRFCTGCMNCYLCMYTKYGR